jgi:hypothetical protein
MMAEIWFWLTGLLGLSQQSWLVTLPLLAGDLGDAIASCVKKVQKNAFTVLPPKTFPKSVPKTPKRLYVEQVTVYGPPQIARTPHPALFRVRCFCTHFM